MRKTSCSCSSQGCTGASTLRRPPSPPSSPISPHSTVCSPPRYPPWGTLCPRPDRQHRHRQPRRHRASRQRDCSRKNSLLPAAPAGQTPAVAAPLGLRGTLLLLVHGSRIAGKKSVNRQCTLGILCTRSTQRVAKSESEAASGEGGRTSASTAGTCVIEYM